MTRDEKIKEYKSIINDLYEEIDMYENLIKEIENETTL